MNRDKNKETFIAITKKIKQQMNKLRNEFYLEEAKHINLAHANKQIEKLFQRSKNQNMLRGIKSATGCKGLIDHFRHHFNKATTKPLPEEVKECPLYLKQQFHRHIVTTDSEPPSKCEIVDCIKKLKNKKASSDFPA